jgi:hypothetical protein
MRVMPLDVKLRRRLEKVLGAVDDRDTRGPRLVEDAQRLWQRIAKFIGMHLVADPDAEALELACYALQLPMRQSRPPTSAKFGRQNLKDRTEQAAELLVTLLDKDADEELLDRAARLLHETPHRSPMVEDARLLADAVNLEDFGVIGLVQQIILLARQGDGVKQVADGAEKREQYGYWEARLKDGFHFEPIRQIARQRVEHARRVAALLAEELADDQP